MTDSIQINFVNHSNDTNNSSVVIFQKNIATDFGELAVAWKVIQNCGIGWHHPFVFDYSIYLSASDAYGNHVPHTLVALGDAFELIENKSGDILTPVKSKKKLNEVVLENSLPSGSINANIYRGGKLLAQERNIVPAQKAAFLFNSIIYIGVAENITEGTIINPAITSTFTEIDLTSLASCDLVMTGGGVGKKAEPYQFELQNVTYAS